MNVLFFQHGNYAEAHARLQAGLPETYRDQDRSVRFVDEMSRQASVTIVSFGDSVHDTAITPDLRSQGVLWSELAPGDIGAIFDATAPDRLICRTPHPGVLREARRRAVPTLPNFADSFDAGGGMRNRLRNFRLRHVLSGSHIPCVANHSLNASRSLAEALRIPATCVVPWDWSRIPMAGPAKTGLAEPGHPRVFFAGGLSAAKGVPDCIKAIAILRGRGIFMSMSFAGTGDRARWENMARDLGVADAVHFLGRIAQTEVRAEMNRHDLVVVPSRHDYPEGFPNTIFEGLSSRSPVVLSDHPAFRGRLAPDTQCLIFEAANPAALADRIERVSRDAALYAQLSETAESALDGLYFGMDWADLVTAFLDDPADRTGWVTQNSLAVLDRKAASDPPVRMDAAP